MGYGITNEAYYSAIASAIRSKAGTSASFAPSEMASAIEAIPSGGGGGTSDPIWDAYALKATLSVPSSHAAGVTRIPPYAFEAFWCLSEVDFPDASFIGDHAFYDCNHLKTARFDSATTVSTYAFYGCSDLTSVEMPECVTIGSHAFLNCTGMSRAVFSKCVSIYTSAFCNTGIREAIFPLATSLFSNAFYGCSNLTSVSFPSVTNLAYYSVFAWCTSLKDVHMPNVTSLAAAAFYACSALESVSFPMLVQPGLQSTFQACSRLRDVYMPNVTSIAGNMFFGCYELKSILLTSASYIYNSAFRECWKLTSVYLLSSSVVSLGGSAVFSGTPMVSTVYTGEYGSIYVPESLYSAYLSSTHWSSIYSSRIVPLTDAQIAEIV